MSPVHLFLLPVLAASAAAQDAPKAPPTDKEEVLVRPLDDRRDLTLLRRVTETTFVHEAARVSFTVPDGWKEIRPHRLSRKIDPRISTVLGIERSDRELVASLYWIPMNPDQKLSNWVRETPTGNCSGPSTPWSAAGSSANSSRPNCPAGSSRSSCSRAP